MELTFKPFGEFEGKRYLLVLFYGLSTYLICTEVADLYAGWVLTKDGYLMTKDGPVEVTEHYNNRWLNLSYVISIVLASDEMLMACAKAKAFGIRRPEEG